MGVGERERERGGENRSRRKERNLAIVLSESLLLLAVLGVGEETCQGPVLLSGNGEVSLHRQLHQLLGSVSLLLLGGQQSQHLEKKYQHCKEKTQIYLGNVDGKVHEGQVSRALRLELLEKDIRAEQFDGLTRGQH